MSNIEKLPYPENIQFTTKELQRYEDEQYEVDKDADEWLDRNYWNTETGRVVIYKNQEDEDLVIKKAEQLLWDLGKGDYRPKTNVDILKYKMDLIRGLYLKETDIDNKKKLFNAVKILGEKIPEAVELDNEAEEQVSMGAEEEQTKQNIIDVKKQKKKKKKDKEDEKRRLYQEEQYKIFEENEKKRAEKKREVPVVPVIPVVPVVKKADAPAKEKKLVIKSVDIKSLSTLSLTELRSVYNASVVEYKKAKEEYTIAEDALNKAQESGHQVQIALKGNAWTSSKEKIKKARDNAEKIKKLYDETKEKVGGKLDATELKGLINASYDGREQVGDWVIDKKLSTNTSKVYTNNEGRAVVAHKGTEGLSDWGNNLAFAVGGEYLYKKTDRFKEAKKVQNKAEKKYGAENVSTIGHSQGGLQAELLGSKSKEIITLNKATHPLSSNQSKNQTDIRSDRDVVSSATKTPTTEIKAISYNPLTEHSPKILDRVSKDTQYGSGLSKQADNISEYDEINKYSNPKKVQEKAKKYLGEGAIIYRSAKKDKKYMIYNPNTKKWVHFGQIPYEDFTKHQDPKRRENYLKRTANMRGNWKNDKYSANNLSREILW